MTRQRKERRFRVHVPIVGDARADDRPVSRLLEAHPGVDRATLSRGGQPLVVDYNPNLIGVADLASIVRSAGYRIA